jgi:hypothetical protein
MGGSPSPQQFMTRKRLHAPQTLSLVRAGFNSGDHRVVMVMKVGQGRIDLCRPQVGVLAENLFGRPSEKILL